MSRARSWCFTVHAANDEEAEEWCRSAEFMPDIWSMSFEDAKVTYCVCQVERGSATERVHVQGAIQFNYAVGLARCKQLNPTAHWEIMRGTWPQNEAYCTKEDTRVAGPFSIGEMPRQGKRTDWEGVKADILAKKTKSEILMATPHLANCVRGIDALIEAAKPKPPVSRDVFVWYLYGPTGTGKTHRAMNMYPDAYVVKGKRTTGSFDNYADEEVLILDEWCSYEWPISEMNSLLDKWKYKIPCRYNDHYARWNKVIICTNEDPDEVYPNLKTFNIWAAFQRRLTHKIQLLDQDKVVNFNSDDE